MFKIIGFYLIIFIIVFVVFYIIKKENPLRDGYFWAVSLTTIFFGTIGVIFFILSSIGPKPPEEGWNRTYFNDGKLQSEFYAEDEKIEGELKHFYKNGNLKFLSSYKNGKQIDTSFAFYENGNIQNISVSNENGKRTYYAAYYESKQLKNESKSATSPNSFHENTHYYLNGQKRFETKILNSNSKGIGVYYYHNGAIKFEGVYKNGRKDGIWKFKDSLNGAVIDVDTFNYKKDREFKVNWSD